MVMRMNATPNPQLIEHLRAYAQKGVDFETARTSLLNAGWLAEDIDAAKSQVEFGVLEGQARSRPAAAATDLTPDQAAGLAMAQDRFHNERRRERNETIMAGIVATPEHPLGAQYLDKFSENLGLSMWTVLGLGALAWALATWLRLPSGLLYLFEGILVILIAWRFYQRYLKKRG